MPVRRAVHGCVVADADAAVAVAETARHSRARLSITIVIHQHHLHIGTELTGRNAAAKVLLQTTDETIIERKRTLGTGSTQE